MRIDGFKTPAINPYRNQQLKTEQAKQQANTQTDKLEISSEAKKLSAVSPVDTARIDRVQQLKAQVQSGGYQVDADKLASSMLSHFNKL